MQEAERKENPPELAFEYVFDNRDELARGRYFELSALYDSQTTRHIENLGIDEGWSCLEVGAGGGSIASWLCSRVGDAGHVLATDIEPRFLQTLPFANLKLRRHDIRDGGLPERQFDLAHARLVLMHLFGRDVALWPSAATVIWQQSGCMPRVTSGKYALSPFVLEWRARSGHHVRPVTHLSLVVRACVIFRRCPAGVIIATYKPTPGGK